MNLSRISCRSSCKVSRRGSLYLVLEVCGKTSTALHVLHDEDVIARYKDHRYFVACDAVTTVDALASLILLVLRVPHLVPNESALLTVLTRAVCALPSTLLLLDNFRSQPWRDLNSRRADVLDLLQKIVTAKARLAWSLPCEEQHHQRALDGHRSTVCLPCHLMRRRRRV